MLKRFISMATAIMMITGVVTASSLTVASATASSDATLNIAASLFKGVSVPTSTAYNCIDCAGPTINQTTLTLTPAEAASTSATTSFVATDAGATVKVLKMASVTLPFNDTNFTNATAWNLTSAAYDQEIILVRVTAADGFTNKYYGWKISAASSDATLLYFRVKGATATLGTPNATITDVVAGAVTITSDSATANATSVARKTDSSNFMPVQVKKVSSGSNPSASDFTSAANFTTGTITDGDILVLKSTAANGTTSLYYKVVVTIGVAQQQQQQQQNNSTPSVEAAAIAAAAQVAKAKSSLVDTLKAGKPITAADLNAADFTVASTKAAERVNAKVLALPESQRADLATVKVIVQKENFVEKVSTSSTQLQVTTTDLVRVGLVASDYTYKSAVVRSLLAVDPSALASIEKVEAAVQAAQSAIQARKDRLAATIKKIYSAK